MSVCLSDIAKIVGVSQNTVSRALRRKSDVSTMTTERINSVALAMGYRPNEASRALRYQKFNSVGMLMGAVNGFYLPQDTLCSFCQTLTEKGYACSLVCTSSVDFEHLSQIPLLKSRIVDSIVIGYTRELPSSVIDEISRMNVPVVWLNRMLEKDAVVVDEGDGVRQLMVHLADCNYDRVMYINYSTDGGADDWVNHVRLQAFDVAAEHLGITPLRKAHRRIPREERYEVTRQWLSQPDRPRAVIVSELTAAQAILETALHMGLRVPEDLAICSFDDTGRRYSSAVPSMTCIIRPEYEFGVAAAGMAVAKAIQPQQQILRREIKYTLAVGGTTVAELSPVSTKSKQ